VEVQTRYFTQEELDRLCWPADRRFASALEQGPEAAAREYELLEALIRGFGGIFVGWTAATRQFLFKQYGHEADVASNAPEERAAQVLRAGLSEDELTLASQVYAGPDNPAAERILGLVQAGDAEGARAEFGRLLEAMRKTHDFRRDWLVSLIAHVYRHHGAEGLELSYRYAGDQDWWEDNMRADLEKSPPERMTTWCDLMVIGNFGEAVAVEDDEKFTINQLRCGSCGAQHSDGRYEPPWNFPLVKESLPMTFSRPHQTVYRAHLGVMHTLQPIEKMGAPWPAMDCSGIKSGPCSLYLYKDPLRAAGRHYESVQKPVPANAYA
jgi:hypothetical protein